MPVHNRDVAEILERVANLLDIKGTNQFRVRAYRNAASTVDNFSRDIRELVESGEDISKYKGIGSSIAEKIEEIVKTGKLQQLEDLEKEIPAELNALMDVEGMGPKKVKALYQELGIRSLDDLEKAAENHKIRELQGFGEKSEETILEEVEKTKTRKQTKRLHYADAEDIANDLVNYLKEMKEIGKITVAGSYRRRKETVGDLDILVTGTKAASIMDRFTAYEDVEKVLSKGETRSSVVLRSGLQIDLRLVEEKQYGSALQYFTGSKEHSMEMRGHAQDQGYKVNEYGVFKGKKRVAGKTEKEVYEKVGYSYIPPELRENRGELEAALNEELPELIKLEDMKGDLHAHSNATDGRNTLEEMAEAAKERGYEYLAITDHSQGLSVTGGLNEDRLKKQIDEIDNVNEKLNGLRLLKGIELDIHEDGKLDLPDRILENLDIVVASIHSKFRLSRDKQTERMIAAIKHPLVTVIAHPTGRMIGKRDPYDIDLDKVFEAAAEALCFMEINAHPDRLDLSDIQAKRGKEMGLRFSISTDAHSTMSLELIRFGINQARRGWLTREDVINTGSLKQLRNWIKKCREKGD